MSRVLKTGENQITVKYGNGHLGVDIVKKEHSLDNIIAHSDGQVVWIQTGYKNNKNMKSGNATYGNCVKIKHDNGYYTLYAHLKEVNVKLNQRVEKGQVIGYMGNSGYAFGAHLHFEVRNEKNVRIDPTPYLDADLPGISNIYCEYRTYDNAQKEFLPKVKDKQLAGNKGHTIGGFQLYTYGGGSTCITASVMNYKNGKYNNSEWLTEVKDGGFGSKDDEYAGIKGCPIDRLMIKSEKGRMRYRGTLLGGTKLPWVTGYNKKDANNGYIGITGKPLQYVEVEFY